MCKNVGIPVVHPTPGMPRTNAIADSTVELVLHVARVALRQAGLEAKFWPYACRLPLFGSVLVFGSCRFLVLLGSSLNLCFWFSGFMAWVYVFPPTTLLRFQVCHLLRFVLGSELFGRCFRLTIWVYGLPCTSFKVSEFAIPTVVRANGSQFGCAVFTRHVFRV